MPRFIRELIDTYALKVYDILCNGVFTAETVGYWHQEGVRLRKLGYEQIPV
jgi:hypothetical protein